MEEVLCLVRRKTGSSKARLVVGRETLLIPGGFGVRRRREKRESRDEDINESNELDSREGDYRD